MTEKPQQTDPEVPHDEELDVEAPNEGATGDNPEDEGEGDSQQASLTRET
jgi:hypothetical protein